MIKARIRNENIAAIALWQSGEGFNKTAFYLTGLPTTTAPSPITTLLLDQGYGVIQPQYIGTFDSEGVFTPETSIETVIKFNETIQKGKLFDIKSEKYFDVSSRLNLLVSHSYGTFVAVGAILRGLYPTYLIMFAPMIQYGKHNEEAGVRVDFQRHVRHISNALPLTYRMDNTKTWLEFFTKGQDFHPKPEKVPTRSQKTKVLMVSGNQDPGLDAVKSEAYCRRFIASYSHIFEFIAYVTVPNASHDVSELLTSNVRHQIEEMLNK